MSIILMDFVRVWVSCAWVWFCEGLLCQFLAKKGEKGFAQMDSHNYFSKMSDKKFYPGSVVLPCDL